jgi:ribose transport system permease protein
MATTSPDAPKAQDVQGDFYDTSEHRSWWSWLVSQQVFWVAIAAIAACLFMALARPDTFLLERNLFNITRNFAFVAIVAIGMVAVIATEGIDLSVGSTVVLSAIVIGLVMQAGYPLWLGILAAIGAGLLVGLVNGGLIALAGMPPFVVTLGMLSVARSLAMVLSNNIAIYYFGPDQQLLFDFGGGSNFGVLPSPIDIPNPVYVLILLLVLTSLAFRWTRWGRYVFAVGGNEQAATLTGVPVRRVKISVYMFSAFCAALAGILMTGWLGGVTLALGQGMELRVIAAAVIGGANLAGGGGTALGAMIGASLLEIIRNSLILLGINVSWQGAFVGTFIIVAAAFDQIRRARGAD